MEMTPEELIAMLERTRRSFKKRAKEETLVNVTVYVASAMRQGATKAEVREAVARGILIYQEGDS